MSSTRNDLPPPVETTAGAIAKALSDLEGDLRRMGLGIQADKAQGVRRALYEMRLTGPDRKAAG